MVFWCLRFPPKNEQKQVDLRYHSSKVEFLHSFFGGNRRHQKPFWNYLTFNTEKELKFVSVTVKIGDNFLEFMKKFTFLPYWTLCVVRKRLTPWIASSIIRFDWAKGMKNLDSIRTIDYHRHCRCPLSSW